MPGFNAQQMQNKVRNTNNVVVLVGDQVVGFGQSSSFGVDYGAEALYGIGNSKPQEIQQLKNGISVSLDMFQLTQAGLAYLGQPSDIGDVLANNQFSISIMDTAGNPIRTAVGCTATSNSVSMAANQPITEAISFIAMDILGPNGLSILNSGGALTLLTAVANVTTSLTSPH
jgi:hypothetical protein